MRGSGNNQKPLTEADRIKQLLIRVGDDGPNFYKRDIDKLSLNLDTYYQKSDQPAKDSVLDLLAECIGSLPHKAAIYATTVSLIGQQNPTIPEALIDKVLEKLRKGVDKGDVYAPRSIMIYLGELMNIGVFNRFLFVNTLFELFSVAERSLKTSHDYYLYIGISVMVYVVDHLKEKSAMELNSLVKTINDLMQTKEKNYLTVLRLRKDQASLNTRLDVLWNAVKAHIESGKKSDLSLLARPYEQYATELAGVKELKKNIKFQFTPKDPKTVCFYQSPHYGLLFEESLLRLEVSSTVDLAILQEKIADALTIFTAKKFALHQLLQINETYNCPHLIIQAILAEMFNLPSSPSKLIFYSSVIVSFINDSPENKRENIKKIVHEAAHTLFTKCAHYDVEILDRFLDWLPHFISNFNFEWDWSEWKYVADSDPSSPEAVLLRNLVRKLVQISFADRVKEALPDELKVFLPSEEITAFEYENPEAPKHGDAQIIREKMNTKPAAQEMIEFFKSGESNIESSGEDLLDLFVQCLLTRCSLTVTHFNVHIERFHSTIIDLMGKESDQLVVLDAVRKFYRNSNFHILLTINGMETFKILDSKNIVNWIFASLEKEEDINNYFQLYWDLLFLIIVKNATNIHVLEQNISRADGRDKIHNAEKELEDAKSEQQTIFSLTFKHLHHLIGEVYINNEEINRVLINRLVEIARRYRNEIVDTFPQIEEDFSSLNKSEIEDALRQVRELAVHQ